MKDIVRIVHALNKMNKTIKRIEYLDMKIQLVQNALDNLTQKLK